MNNRTSSIVSWLIVIWISKVFLFSLPYKFSGHPDTQHIFGTIGAWITEILGNTVGDVFTQYGAYAVGTVELITSLILLAPALIWLVQRSNKGLNLPSRNFMHGLGGLMATNVMCGAVFFHLATPLGVEVLHEGQSDNGSLFYAAVSIALLGTVLFVINYLNWTASNATPNR